MNKDIAVIQAFKIPIEINELELLKRTHTYISDKLILDAVNGIKVVATDLNNISKSREKILPRMFDGITGKSAKRQNLINENLIEGINACTTWLRDHDRHISSIDNRICDIANELNRTQDEILKFYGQHRTLRINVDILKDSFYSFKESSVSRMDSLENFIQTVDIRDRAYNLIDREFEALKADKYIAFDTPIQIYTVLDNIKSGDGGLYYHSKIDTSEKFAFQEYIKHKFINHISDKFDKNYLNQYIDFNTLISTTNSLEKLEKNALSFVSTQHYNIMIKDKQYPQISDLISIVSSYSNDEAKSMLHQSTISNFISYNDFIEDTIKEHLLV